MPQRSATTSSVETPDGGAPSGSRWRWRPTWWRYAATRPWLRSSAPSPRASASPTSPGRRAPAPSSTGLLAAVMGLVGVGHLVALVDARTPLLVADTRGCGSGSAAPGAVSRGERSPASSTGRGVARSETGELVAGGAAPCPPDRGARPRRLGVSPGSPSGSTEHRSPCRWPCRPGCSGAGDDLTAALTALAGDARPRSSRSRTEPTAAARLPWRDPRPQLGRAHRGPGDAGAPRRTGRRARRLATPAHVRTRRPRHPDEPLVASATPGPLRDPVTAQRARGPSRGGADPTEPEGGRELRRPGSVNLVEDTQVWSERVQPDRPSRRRRRAAAHRRLRRRACRGARHRAPARSLPAPGSASPSTSSPSAPGSGRTSSSRSRSTTSRRAAATSTPAATCAPSPGCSASTSRRC